MTETPESVAPSTISPETFTTEVEINSLVTDFYLHLHTTAVCSIFEGEWQNGKMGLRQFVSQLNVLLKAFEKKDPYAEWQLLKIYDTSQKLKTELQTQASALRKQLSYLRGMRIKPFRNPKPYITAFSSASPLVLMAANLITEIDLMACQILTLKQMGIVPHGQVDTLSYRTKIQAIFALSNDWEQSDIIREDILENTKKAQRLEKKYGKLPEDIVQNTADLKFLFLTG